MKKPNSNLINLIKILNQSKEKSYEFSKKNSMEELYEYCHSIVDGYSFEEFEEFMINIAKTLDNNLTDEDFKKISGGKSVIDYIESFDEGMQHGSKLGCNMGTYIKDIKNTVTKIVDSVTKKNPPKPIDPDAPIDIDDLF